MTSKQPATRLWGIPTWAALCCLIVFVAAASLLGVKEETMGHSYAFALALAALVPVAIVEARGLFLTWALFPLIFAIAVPATQWTIGAANLPDGASSRAITTAVATAIYPLASLFPVLISIVIGGAIIAGLRLYLAMNKLTKQPAIPVEERENRRIQDATNIAQANQARQLSRRARRPGAKSQVTVQELLQRSQEPSRDAYSDANSQQPVGRSRVRPRATVTEAERLRASQQRLGEEYRPRTTPQLPSRTNLPQGEQPRQLRGDVTPGPADPQSGYPRSTQRGSQRTPGVTPRRNPRRITLDDDLYS